MYQRFGEVTNQYDGLYWSHFHAAIDWDDAEMWLEGAIQNGFSVSQMRGKRWETLGNTSEPPAVEDDSVEDPYFASQGTSDPAIVQAPDVTPVAHEDSDEDVSETLSAADPAAGTGDRAFRDPPPVNGTQPEERRRSELEIDDLPADVADAFEQFKLAIITHRRTNWAQASPELVVECLDALREIALAPIEP